MMDTKDIHILVVEDSPTQAAKLRYVLERRGHRVSVASSGREAIASMAQDTPTVVLSDIVMPEMDGYELCRHIKAHDELSAVPVLLLTALSDPRDILRALACGAENFVTKPCKDEVLFDRLDRVLSGQGSDREAKTPEGPTITFDGETYVLPPDVRQIATLLLSTYQEAVERRVELERVNGELKQAQQGLKALNESLEQKVRERTAELQASEANYRTLLETSIHAIVVVDSDKTVRYANKAARELLGPENGKRVGTAFDLPFSTAETVEHTLGRPSSGDRVLEIRTENTTWEGTPAHFLSLIDVTEQRGAEEVIRRAQEEELRLRDRFLSHASHELRTPVAAVYQFVTILLDGLGGELSPEQRKYLQIVFRNIEELKSMVDDLMDVARGEAEGWDIHPEAVDIVPAIKQAQQHMASLSQARDIKVTMAGPDSLPDAFADPKRVRRVVLNLITHAVQHTPEGGTVRVWWGVDAENPARLRVSVTDGAEALGEHDRLRAFDKMHQVGHAIDDGRKGLGMGLHIAKALVCGQDGRIWAESVAPRGNTFFFTLPLSSQSGTPATHAREKQGREKTS